MLNNSIIKLATCIFTNIIFTKSVLFLLVSSHSLDGIVVAEEYEEVLREAWHQQEQLLIEKDIKKREQRVMERWKKLTRGLLIRERVKKTYEMVNTAS